MNTVHPLEVGNLVEVIDGDKKTMGIILQVYAPDEDNLYKDWSTLCGGYEVKHPDGVFIWVAPEKVRLVSSC